MKLASPESDYFTEATERFRALCEGRKLIANIDHREGQLLHLRLIDPSDPTARTDPLAACINIDLLREGLASIDRKGCKYLAAYPPNTTKRFQDAVLLAKRDHQGIFEFGDIEEDD